MWILQTDGDALKGKRLWLRPGKRFIFGRTKQDDNGDNVVVSNKTISRKHLTLSVAPVGADDCQNASTRSKVTVTDLDTKLGTLLNGVQIRGQSIELKEDENAIQLGKYECHFHITWISVTLTFSYTSEETQMNLYSKLYKSLGPVDIKVLANYDRELTTHVAVTKRDTVTSIQALIDAKYIVHHETFTAAIIAAVSPDETGSSPLEQNFDENFPNPCGHLPPTGDEPTLREESSYAPNLLRQNMFNNYTFVFYDERQYETLLAPITAGRGKALIQAVKPFETTVAEFVRYVENVDGETGLGELKDESEGKGVVVVRFNPDKGPGVEWYAEFGRQVALKLDHRLIEQSDFLDAILGIDASVLRRSLQMDYLNSAALLPPAGTLATTANKALTNPENAPSIAGEVLARSPPRRTRNRRVARSRFVGFEDDFLGLSNPQLSSLPESNSMHLDALPPIEGSRSQDLFVPQDLHRMSEESETQIPPILERKRRFDPKGEKVAEDITQWAPNTIVPKRRRLSGYVKEKQREESTPYTPLVFHSVQTSETNDKESDLTILAEAAANKRKNDIDADVEEILRQKRKREADAEARAKENSELLDDPLEGLDIADIRKRIQVEDMEVRGPNRASRAGRIEDGYRWNEQWNGRKNFKKFKRRGDVGVIRGFEKVIVQLVEVRKRDFGISGYDWEDDGRGIRKVEEVQETNGMNQLGVQTQIKATRKCAERDTSAANLTRALTEDSGGNSVTQGQYHENSPDMDTEIHGSSAPNESFSRFPRPNLDRAAHARERDLSALARSEEKGKDKKRSVVDLSDPAQAKKPSQRRRQMLMKTNITVEEESNESDDDLAFKFRKTKTRKNHGT